MGTTFRCARCGCRRLEEILVNVTRTTAVEGVDGDGLLVYGDSSTEGGEIDRFQCRGCGDVVRDGRGSDIASMEALVYWLRAQGERRKARPA